MAWLKATDPTTGVVSYINDGTDTGQPLIIEVDPEADLARRVRYCVSHVEADNPDATVAEVVAYFDNLYGV